MQIGQPNMYEVKTNEDKTTVMRIARHEGTALNVRINNIRTEKVKRIKFLDSIITSEGRCGKGNKGKNSNGEGSIFQRKRSPKQQTSSEIERLVKAWSGV